MNPGWIVGAVPGRPTGWKASDEAFSEYLTELQASRTRVRNLRRWERVTLPPWAVAARGYMARTEQYRQLLREQAATETTTTERTA